MDNGEKLDKIISLLEILVSEKEEDKKPVMSVEQFRAVMEIGRTAADEFTFIPGFPVVKKGARKFIVKSKLNEWLEANIGQTFE